MNIQNFFNNEDHPCVCVKVAQPFNMPTSSKYHNHLPETLEKSESMKSHPHPYTKQSFMNLHLPSMQLKNFNALSLILAFLLSTGFTFANGYNAASPKPAAAQLQYVLDHAVDGQMIVLPAVVEDVLTIRSGVSLLTSGTSVVKGIVMDAPGKTVKLLGNLKVEGTLEFKEGILDAGEYILETKEILGADADSYLVMAGPPPPPGSLTLNVPTSGTVVFPIGTNSGFTPVTVSATAAHITDLMTIAVADKMNLSDFTAPTPVGPSFAEFEWNVSETVNGGSEVNLKMEFPTDPHNLKIVLLF
ncbi:MAG: hypothetical protein IPP06_06240 [Saprospiraceae bacterium]|nr:hypothetical protein [Candidatus Vicinibacter affinis]